MQIVVLCLLVAAVAVDAIARLDRSRARGERRSGRDLGLSSTQKIIVDLSRRG